jgi:predicted small lipoprotein YifL
MSQEKAAPARRRPPIARIVIVAMVVAMLAGCGKKGNPTPPTGEPNTYPRAYPAQ